MEFQPGFAIQVSPDTLSFQYGADVFGPAAEMRTLDAIRASLRDPACSGPDPVYGIAMDVGRESDRSDLESRMLLFGAVVYAAGQVGDEPVRSQGHIHAIARHSGWSPPEIFEIWEGAAVIYAQESAGDDPGRCFAVHAGPGDQVVVPPGWAHCVINADPGRRMAFGAWCDRQYGFDYTGVRAHGGLAWFPLLKSGGALHWEANPRYSPSRLQVKLPESYSRLGLKPSQSIYEQYREDPFSVQWVSAPQTHAEVWKKFTP